MLKINRQTDYAIRMVLSLAKRGEGVRTSTTEILQEMLIPPALAQRIVADLARGGFVTTIPGRDGGLMLAYPARSITLRQIVEHFESKLMISDCLLEPGNCPFGNKCPVRCRWGRLQAIMMQELESTTFEDLVQDALAISDMTSLGLPQSVSLSE